MHRENRFVRSAISSALYDSEWGRDGQPSLRDKAISYPHDTNVDSLSDLQRNRPGFVQASKPQISSSGICQIQSQLEPTESHCNHAISGPNPLAQTQTIGPFTPPSSPHVYLSHGIQETSTDASLNSQVTHKLARQQATLLPLETIPVNRRTYSIRLTLHITEEEIKKTSRKLRAFDRYITCGENILGLDKPEAPVLENWERKLREFLPGGIAAAA